MDRGFGQDEGEEEVRWSYDVDTTINVNGIHGVHPARGLLLVGFC